MKLSSLIKLEKQFSNYYYKNVLYNDESLDYEFEIFISYDNYELSAENPHPQGFPKGRKPTFPFLTILDTSGHAKVF